MAITQTTLTVLPTARPWNFAAIAAHAGAASSEVGYNVNFTDGSSAGGTGTENQSFAYGQQHTNGAETAPHTVACSPGDRFIIAYTSGTAKWFSSGTLYGPEGDISEAAVVSPSIDYTDSDGYVQPTDCMPKAHNIAKANPTTGTVGLCGVFTDSGGNAIDGSFWDWKNLRMPSTVFALNSVATHSGATTVYTGTITGGGSNAFAGFYFVVVGFSTAANNGTFVCTASSATTLTLSNGAGAAETKSATAALRNTIILTAPANAAFLSIGIDDGLLHDNGGTGFTITVTNLSSVSAYMASGTSTNTAFPRVPVGMLCTGDEGAIKPSYLSNVWVGQVLLPLYNTDVKGLLRSNVGQLFPRGAALSGSSGQNFPV